MANFPKKLFFALAVFTQSIVCMAQNSQLWTGDGGKGLSLAILLPESQGLRQRQAYLPLMVQGALVSNFSRYSAIDVRDRVSLDNVIQETLDPGYKDNEEIIRLGHIAQVRYMMTGRIIATSTGFTLQINVIDTTDAKTKASYSGFCTEVQLDNQTAVRLASKELLMQMGVSLTQKAIEELDSAGSQNSINAEITLAKGIVALKQGTVVEALSYFLESSSFDPGLLEAASRINIISSDISTGNIGEDIRNDIKWYNEWLGRLKEFETFYTAQTNEPPPYYLVYTTDIKKGKINYANSTVSFSIDMFACAEASWFDRINSVYRIIKEGLESTNMTKEWEFNWPVKTVSAVSPFRELNSIFSVSVEIINSNGISIGSQTVNIPYGWRQDRDTWHNIILPRTGSRIINKTAINFPAVKADLITDKLVIKIASVDGLSPENASRQKRVSTITEGEYNRLPSVLEYGMEYENLINSTYKIPYSTVEISGKPREYSGSIVIPSSVYRISASLGNNLSRVTIGANVEMKLSNLERFVIDDNAFEGFVVCYLNNGRKAGVYEYFNGRWVRFTGTENEITEQKKADTEQIHQIADEASIRKRERDANVAAQIKRDSILWSVGVNAGTSFASPLFVFNINLTLPVFRRFFLEGGFDLGLGHGLFSSIKDVKYRSMYYYGRLNYSMMERGGGAFIGLGGGFMDSRYKFPKNEKSVKTAAADFVIGYFFGINNFSMFRFDYAVRTNFTGWNMKFNVGYAIRFGYY